MSDLEKKTFSTQEGSRLPGGKQPKPDREPAVEPPKPKDEKR